MKDFKLMRLMRNLYEMQKFCGVKSVKVAMLFSVSSTRSNTVNWKEVFRISVNSPAE